MILISGNIGGVDFPEMKRGYFYKFTYVNLKSSMKKAMIINPIIVFSALDRNRRIHGLDLRSLRAPEVFLEDYENFYYKDGKMNDMFVPEHPYAFSHRILKSLFMRNPDVEDAWRMYNPLYTKNIKLINIDEVRQELKKLNKVSIKNMGIL